MFVYNIIKYKTTLDRNDSSFECDLIIVSMITGPMKILKPVEI